MGHPTMCGKAQTDIVHYDWLLAEKRLTSTINKQLSRVEQAIEKNSSVLVNKKGFTYRHDSARPHTYPSASRQS